jgi:hypothetical protein
MFFGNDYVSVFLNILYFIHGIFYNSENKLNVCNIWMDLTKVLRGGKN